MRLRAEPIWLFNALLGAAGLALLALVVRHYAPAETPALPWGLLAPAVLATERWPVELHFGRSSHSFSLTDITVTLALVFSSGAGAVAGVTLGAGAALALRRLPPVKLVFNVAQFMLVTAISVLIVRIG